MNKHIINSLAEYDFKYEKNYGYGHINGYEVNVFNNFSMPGPFFLFSTYLPQRKKNDFIVQMNDKKFSLVQVNFFDYGVMVMIGAVTAKGFEKKFKEVLPVILNILETLEAPKADICPQSGDPIDETDCKMISLPNTQTKIRLSSKAVAVVNSNIEKSNQDFKNAPNNYLKGFGGIIIGAFAGLVVSVIMSLTGFITALSAWASIFVGTTLYKKFGGKPNWVMIVMSFVTTLIFILGGMVLMYALAAQGAALEVGLEMEPFEALKYLIDNSTEFEDMFNLDIALTALFIGIAEACSIGQLVRSVRRPKAVQ